MSKAIRRGIYGRLSGDTTLTNLLGTAAPGYTKGIYHGQAPSGAVFPFVILQKSSGNPTEAFGPKNTPTAPVAAAFDTEIWLVKAVDRNTTADRADDIADRLVTLLNDAPLSVSGKNVLFLRRQSDVDYPEDEDGVSYWHAGSLYRLTTD